MDLDILKKDWSELKSPAGYGHFYTSKDINLILRRKSRNASRRILYFTIIEFAFWLIAGLVFNLVLSSYNPQSFAQSPILLFIERANYFIIATFIYTFYYYYKKISISRETDIFIGALYNLSRIAKYYILYNLLLFEITFQISLIWEFYNNQELITVFEKDPNMRYVIYLWATIFSFVFGTLTGLIYWLIFGRNIRMLLSVKRDIET